MRKCPRCGVEHDRSQAYCKPCHAAYMREHRPPWSAIPEEAKAKANARSYANVYLKRGIIAKGPCAQCGSLTSEMHHSDYSKPLDVRWLCRPCHLAEHR